MKKTATLLFSALLICSMQTMAQAPQTAAKPTPGAVRSGTTAATPAKTIISNRKVQILVTPDLDCVIKHNGKVIGLTKGGTTRSLMGIMGDNLIEADLTVNNSKWSETVTIKTDEKINYAIKFLSRDRFMKYIREGNFKMAEMAILKNPEYVNPADESMFSPLVLAAEKRQVDIVKMLVDKGATINTSSEPYPIASAVISGNYINTKLFLDNGADLSVKTSDKGYTPLHLAAFFGKEDLAAMLMDKGADLNAKDNQGLTPLQLAQERGNVTIAEIMKKKRSIE